MFKSTTKIDKNVHKELNGPLKKKSLVSLIVGTIGLCAYIVLSTFFESFLFDLLIVFVAPFAFGLIMVLTIKKIEKNAPILYLPT